MDNNQRSVPSSPAPGHAPTGYSQYQENLHQDERTTPPTAFHFPQTHQAQQAPVMGQPTGIPMQVLIDPATGQHYMIPQYYPPPMYPYPSAQPIHAPPPMYYHYGPAPSHAPVSNHPPAHPTTTSAPNISSTNSINYMGMPMYNNPVSTQEEKDGSEDATSSTSSLSRNSFTLMQNQKMPLSQQQQFGRENSREYMYLHRSPTNNPPPSSPLMRPKLFHQRLETVTDPRGGTQSDFEGKTPTMRQKSVDHQASSASDHESTKRFSRTSFGTPANAPIEELVRAVNPPAKSVRMEINFDDVPAMPTEPKPAKKSNATAFTVNLGQEKEVSLQEAARTLAENRRKIKLAKSTSHDRTPSTPEALAASKTNKNYLLERLLTGKTGTTIDNSNEEETEDIVETPEEHKDFDARSEALTFVIDTSRRNNQGGGYGGQTQFQQHRVVQYSDDDDSDSDSEFMEQYTSNQPSKPSQPHQTAAPPPPPSQPQQTPIQPQLPSPRPSALPAPGFSRNLSSTSTLTTQTIPSAMTSPRTPSTSTVSTPRTTSRFDRSGGGGSDFLQELAKLRMMAGLPAAGPTGSEAEQRAMMLAHQKPTTTFRRSEVSSSARAPTVSSSQKAVGIGERGGSRASFTGKTKETNTTPTPTRRSENRRSLTGNSSPQLSNLTRPPFRSGATNRGIMIGQSEQQREQEMTAWLRRKDYNPMKAAAAGKKPSNEMTREQQFQSRRSMTFHNTDEVTSPFGRTSSGMIPTRPPPRNRSQEPRDINNEKYRSVQKDQRLKRTVDMLSEKCKKSIELIRIQNKGCLSVSVEDLLSAAAEEPRPNETLDDQLDRLSDAFDAVQRYLEQYSLDGYHSPTSDDRYFDDDVLEAKSTFSGVSTHQDRHTVPSTESLTSSYRKKILDS